MQHGVHVVEQDVQALATESERAELDGAAPAEVMSVSSWALNVCLSVHVDRRRKCSRSLFVEWRVLRLALP
eukprot:419923-Amphidinium_carterae.2